MTDFKDKSKGWISIKEEKPDYYEIVLVKKKHLDGVFTAWMACMDDESLMFTVFPTEMLVHIEDIEYWKPIE